MTEKQNPEDLLEFPCVFQYKALGIAGRGFERAIVAAVKLHASVSKNAVKSRPSGKGNFQSVSVLVSLHSYQQLTEIYTELRKVEGLKMLL